MQKIFENVWYLCKHSSKKTFSQIGWPTDIYQKIMSHCTTRMVIKEVGCQLVFDFKSDAMPKEAAQGETAFKFGEEFEWKNPFDPTDKLTVW